MTVTEPVTNAVTSPVTHPKAEQRAPQLGTRGRRLWKQLTDDGAALKPAERVLLEEACRTADRLDTLDRILRGDEDAWMRFRALNEDGTVVSVVINNVLAEARQQQTTLARLIAELRTSQASGAAPKTPGARPPAAKEEAGDVSASSPGVVSLAARIAAKRGGTATG